MANVKYNIRSIILAIKITFNWKNVIFLIGTNWKQTIQTKYNSINAKCYWKAKHEEYLMMCHGQINISIVYPPCFIRTFVYLPENQRNVYLFEKETKTFYLFFPKLLTLFLHMSSKLGFLFSIRRKNTYKYHTFS